MEYNFIRLKPNNTFVTVTDPSSKPRLLCFNDKSTTNKAILDLCNFRSRYGYWPNIDLSKTSEKIVPERSFKKRTTLELLDYLEIYSLDEYGLDKMCSENCIDFFYCFNFEMSGFENDYINLLLTAQELDCSVDDYKYRRTLDHIFYV